jgi:hypothetical protein
MACPAPHQPTHRSPPGTWPLYLPPARRASPPPPRVPGAAGGCGGAGRAAPCLFKGNLLGSSRGLTKAVRPSTVLAGLRRRKEDGRERPVLASLSVSRQYTSALQIWVGELNVLIRASASFWSVGLCLHPSSQVIELMSSVNDFSNSLFDETGLKL